MKAVLTRIRRMLTILDTNQAQDFFREAQAIFRPTLLDLGCPEALISYQKDIGYNYNPKSTLSIRDKSTSTWSSYDQAILHPLANIYSMEDLVITQELTRNLEDFRLTCSFTLWFNIPEEEQQTLWNIGKIKMVPGLASPAYASLACGY